VGADVATPGGCGPHGPWLSLLFFIPYINYMLMLLLSVLPTAVRPPAVRQAEFRHQGRLLREALVGIAAGLAVSVPTVLISVFIVKSYSTPLFLGTPFSLGAIHRVFREPATASVRWATPCGRSPRGCCF